MNDPVGSIMAITKSAYLAGCYNNDPKWEENKALYDQQFDGYWGVNKDEVLAEACLSLPNLQIIINPITLTSGLVRGETRAELAWGNYRGWKGKIIKESMNGTIPSYWVSISSNGVNFVKMNINKSDIEFYYGER